MTKIGILGGTFDPIHQGHLRMAYEAARQAKLDQVLFMPSKIPPHKRDRMISEEAQRAQMICLAIRGQEGFRYSDFELRRNGTTYTADTLRLLQEQYPEQQYYFIMGGDSFLQLESWSRPEEIMARAVILAISRDGLSMARMRRQAEGLEEKYQARIQVIRMPQMDISSSLIRDRVRQGRDITGLVPENVAVYIREHSLYRSESR